MGKRKKTSFETTELTEKLLNELKAVRWDYTEVINAGIVAFSQLNEIQRNAFKEIAYKIKNNFPDKAHEIVRDWILRVVEDAQENNEKKKQPQSARPAKSG